MKTQFDYDTGMGIYLTQAEKVPTFRAAYVYRLECWSRLDGGRDLVGDDGRLVGVAPEARGAPGKIIVKLSLETALRIVNEHMGTSGIVLKTK